MPVDEATFLRLVRGELGGRWRPGPGGPGGVSAWVSRRGGAAEPGVRPGLEGDASGRHPGGVGRQHHPGRDGQDPRRRVGRPLVPRPGRGWRSSAGGMATAGTGPERRGAGPRREPARRPAPPGDGPGGAGAAGRGGAGQRGPGPRRRLPAPPARARPGHRPARRPRPVRPGADLPAGAAPRAGRVAPAGRGGRPVAGRPGRRADPAGRSGRGPSGSPGRSAGPRRGTPRSTWIDADGRPSPWPTWTGGGSRRSAGSATPRGSAGPWRTSGSTWSPSGRSPTTTPTPRPTWPTWPTGSARRGPTWP